MNIFIWIVAGGMLGWTGYRFWSLNEKRAPAAAIVIGAVGGIVGGHLIAPMFLSATSIPGNFSSTELFFAVAIAASFLFVGSMVHKRWGF